MITSIINWKWKMNLTKEDKLRLIIEHLNKVSQSPRGSAKKFFELEANLKELLLEFPKREADEIWRKHQLKKGDLWSST